MNQTLEEVAHALFRSWFVDFDPVRAKAALNQHALAHHAAHAPEPSEDGATPADEWPLERARNFPAGMESQIADLFPDRLVNSELGGIPEGWDVLPAGRAVTVYGGSTPSTREPSYWGGDHYFATPKDLSTLNEPILASTARRLTDAGIDRISSGILPSGTVLLSSRAPIGYLAITNVPTTINQGIIAMVCEGSVAATYALHWARANMPVIEDRASGTTFAEINKTSFRSIPFLMRPNPPMPPGDSIVTPIYRLITSNQQQSRDISAQRDTLLPKLISGEVSVKLT